MSGLREREAGRQAGRHRQAVGTQAGGQGKLKQVNEQCNCAQTLQLLQAPKAQEVKGSHGSYGSYGDCGKTIDGDALAWGGAKTVVTSGRHEKWCTTLIQDVASMRLQSFILPNTHLRVPGTCRDSYTNLIREASPQSYDH
jgi:hypothetical protein